MPVVQPTGSPPHFGNYYVMAWSFLNIFIVIAIVVLIFWYLKKRNDERKELFNKLDTIIMYLQNREKDND